MTRTVETHGFQAEVQELLGLMIHSLYSQREVFLRELISNASDALDKLRFESLTRPELAGGNEELAVRIEIAADERELALADNGIGMNRADLIEHLGTIASSGTKRFLAAARERGTAANAPELIGQFGVGFYASFMVADEIVVESRKAGESEGWRWSSRGDGNFTLEPCDLPARGTRVRLRLKAPEEQGLDFADPARIAELVRRWSDFVIHPIEMAAALLRERGSLKTRKAADGLEVVVLNSQRPLWSRAKDEITPREYLDFYRHLTHAFDEPLETLHFKAEGSSEYTALLFLPSERPFEMFDPAARRSQVALYVRRVLVTPECEDLVPTWLRFVRGVVDASDLPLNVSRETLQKNRQMAAIHKHLVKKVLDAIHKLRQDRREDFVRFSRAFGPVLKEGVVLESGERERIAGACAFESSRGEGLTTLDEYVARMGADQPEILVLVGPDLETCRRSPHLEALAKRGREVLLCVDPIDEWLVERLSSFAGKPLRAIDRGRLAELDASKDELEAAEREHRALLETLEARLTGQVAGVRLSARLEDSAAVLVDDEHALGRHMERMLRESGQSPPPRKRILELNPKHPLFARLVDLARQDPASPRLSDFVDLLHAQALLAEGSPPADPVRFSRLLGELLLRA